MAETPDHSFDPEEGENILSAAQRIVSRVVYGTTREMESLVESSRRVGLELAREGIPYRDGDVRDKERYDRRGPRGAIESTMTYERDEDREDDTEEQRRAEERTRMMTRSSSLVTLKLIGMTGGVRQRIPSLPPLPQFSSNGAAEENNTAAGGDAPPGAIDQPQTDVSVTRHTSEKSRDDGLVDAGNRSQRWSLSEELEPSGEEVDRQGDDATGKGDESRHPPPSHPGRGDERVEEDANVPFLDATRLRDGMTAVGGEKGVTLSPVVKAEDRRKSNRVHDGVRKSVHDSRGKIGQWGFASPEEADRWFSLCRWDAQGDLLGGPTERIYYLGAICGMEPGDRPELGVDWCAAARKPAYLLRLDTAERVLVDLLTLNRPDVEEGLETRGIPHAIAVRQEWAKIMKGLLVETRPGQHAELWRRTSRVLDDWQRKKIPGYDAGEASLDDLVSESESELCQRDRRIKKTQPKQGKRKDGAAPSRQPSKGAVGPPKPDPPSKPKVKDERRDPSPDPLASLRAAVAKAEARDKEERQLRARLRALNQREYSPVPQEPVHKKGAEPPSKDHGDIGQCDRQGSLLQKTATLDPYLTRYYNSPFVGAAEQYKETRQAQKKRGEEKRKSRRSKRRSSSEDESESGDNEREPTIPTSVRFKDRIRNLQKFNKPDSNQTWLDFLQHLVEILTMYNIHESEWAGWLIDRLTGKAQSALMNLTVTERYDWATLVSALNSYFHTEVEMRTAEEELLVRKQGPKESVRDFTSQLMFLARKAYGQDVRKREAAVLKRIELGLNSASLRRTFDEVTVRPVGLSVLVQELVRRESRDDPGKYQTFITQEKEKENAAKPRTPPTANVVRLQDVLDAKETSQTSAEVNAASEMPGKKETAASAKKKRPQRRDRRSGTAGDGKEGPSRGRAGFECWKCGLLGHSRWLCPKATHEDIDAWRAQDAERQRAAKKGGKTGAGPRENAKPSQGNQGGGGPDQPASAEPPKGN